MSVISYRMNRLTEPRNIDEVANLATQQQSQILFRVFPQCWCGWHSGVPRMKIVLTRSQAGQMGLRCVLFRCQKEIRGAFDEETRRKPLAFAADAVSYGI